MLEKINYVKEAFKRQENVITLAGLAIAGVAFNGGFLLLGGALEIVYLWMISSDPRFQRVVNSEKNRAVELFDANEKQRLAALLPKADRERYQELAAIRQKVYASWEDRDALTKSILQPGVDKLEYLLDTFLRTQLTLNRMRDHLADSDKSFIEKQAQMLELDLKRNISDKVKEVKSKNLEILRQRMIRLQKLSEDMDVVKTQLDTLENAIKFVSDQSVALTDPQQITDQIDHVVAEVGETERSIKDVEVFLGAQDEMSKKQEAARQDRIEERRQ